MVLGAELLLSLRVPGNTPESGRLGRILSRGCSNKPRGPLQTALSPEQQPYAVSYEMGLLFRPSHWPQLLPADLPLPGLRASCQHHPQIHHTGSQRPWNRMQFSCLRLCLNATQPKRPGSKPCVSGKSWNPLLSPSQCRHHSRPTPFLHLPRVI